MASPTLTPLKPPVREQASSERVRPGEEPLPLQQRRFLGLGLAFDLVAAARGRALELAAAEAFEARRAREASRVLFLCSLSPAHQGVLGLGFERLGFLLLHFLLL